MKKQTDNTGPFLRFQVAFWLLAGLVLLGSGLTQMTISSAVVRNFYLPVAAFLASFFLRALIDRLSGGSPVRLRLTLYPALYLVAMFCVVFINAITLTQWGYSFGELTFGHWTGGALNFALVLALWAELYMQRVYERPQESAGAGRPIELSVEHRGVFKSIPLQSISHIRSAGDYVEIFAAGETYLDRRTIQSLESTLPGDGFVRVHRSVIVNRESVTAVTPLGGGRYRLALGNDHTVESSRGYATAVRQAFRARGD